MGLFNKKIVIFALIVFMSGCAPRDNQSGSEKLPESNSSSTFILDTPTLSYMGNSSHTTMKLSPQQIKKLKDVVGVGKDFKTQSVVVLPANIPDGFKITHFSVWKQTHPSPRFVGGRYDITFLNKRNECFGINGGVVQPIGDEPTKYEKIISLSSPALGTIDLGVTDGDTIKHGGFLGFTESMNRIFKGRNEYSFESPVMQTQSKERFQLVDRCHRMTKEDATRVVQSMQFFNP
jgi:hypothetical protein